jgi:hypothetical protein
MTAVVGMEKAYPPYLRALSPSPISNHLKKAPDEHERPE